MSQSRLPGPLCTVLNKIHIDAGTLCRQPSPMRAPLGIIHGNECALLSLTQLRSMFTKAKSSLLEEYFLEFKRRLPIAGINTPQRVAFFMAMVNVETKGMTCLEENNFTYRDPVRARRLFKNLSGMGNDAIHALGHGDLFANTIYAGVGGNGDAASGDGFRFRGRGLFNLTTKNNYQNIGTAIGVDLIHHPELILKPANDVAATVAYWNNNHLNRKVDLLRSHVQATDAVFIRAVRVINSGLAGIDARANAYNRYIKILMNHHSNI